MQNKHKMSEEEVHRIASVATKTFAIVIFALLAVLVGAALQRMVLLPQMATFSSLQDKGFASETGALDLRYTAGEVVSTNASEGELTISPNGTERTFMVDKDTKFVMWSRKEESSAQESNVNAAQTESNEIGNPEETTSSEEMTTTEESTATSARPDTTMANLPEAPYTTEDISLMDLKKGMTVGVYTDKNITTQDQIRAIVVAVTKKQMNMDMNNKEGEQEMSGTNNEASTIADVVTNTEKTSTLETAVKQADLVETLSGNQQLTVFAPTNSAFNTMNQDQLDNLLMDTNKSELQTVLKNHVVQGAVTSDQLSDGQMVTTLSGKQLEVQIIGDEVYIGEAQVTQADMQASNGVIHTIDSVITN